MTLDQFIPPQSRIGVLSQCRRLTRLDRGSILLRQGFCRRDWFWSFVASPLLPSLFWLASSKAHASQWLLSFPLLISRPARHYD